MKNISILILAGLLATPVFADEAFNKLYGGAGIGYGVIDDDISGLEIEYDEVSAKIFAGFWLTDNISAEIQYNNFSKGELININGVSLNAKGNSFGVAGLYNFTPQYIISPFVKLGYHTWDWDLDVDGFAGSFSDDGNDLFYGVGVNIKVTDTISGRIEYERFELDEIEVHNTGASVVFNF